MVSVCMATYNGEKFIREQIESILPQLGREDELIVSDDHSTDQTVEIVRSFNDGRIRICSNPGKRGYTNNFSNALYQAKGDYVFLCDQDDVWLPDKVATCVDALSKVDFVNHNCKVVDNELRVLDSSFFDKLTVRTGFLNNFVRSRYVGCCMAFRKEVLKAVIPFPPNPKLCAHDYWIACVAELLFHTSLVKEPLTLYRRHGSNATNAGLDKSPRSVLFRMLSRGYCLLWLVPRKLAQYRKQHND